MSYIENDFYNVEVPKACAEWLKLVEEMRTLTEKKNELEKELNEKYNFARNAEKIIATRIANKGVVVVKDKYLTSEGTSGYITIREKMIGT